MHPFDCPTSEQMKEFRVENPAKTEWKSAIVRVILNTTHTIQLTDVKLLANAFIELTDYYTINERNRLVALSVFIKLINQKHIYIHPTLDVPVMTMDFFDSFNRYERKR